MQKSVFRRFGEAFSVMKTKTGLFLIGMYFAAVGIMIMPMRSPLLWLTLVLMIPVGLVMSALFTGLSGIFLRTVRSEKADIMNLFDAFADVNTLKRVVGGSVFMVLILMLWSYIPCLLIIYAVAIATKILIMVTGMSKALMIARTVITVVCALTAIVLLFIKIVEFSFTPYILISRPEVRATEAVKESKRLTKGHRRKIFAAVFLPIACWHLIYIACWYLIYIACWYLMLFVAIGVPSPLLRLVAVAVCSVVALAVIQVFYQLVTAGFYNDVYQASLQGQDNI